MGIDDVQWRRRVPRRPALRLALLAMALTASALGTNAASLRIATAFDPQTMDPHALALLYHSRIALQIHDSLIGRDEQFRLEPALALSWRAVDETTWRFKLRPGVTFHDGAPFGADDVVFSIERALAPPSQRAFQLKGIAAARRIDRVVTLPAPGSAVTYA